MRFVQAGYGEREFHRDWTTCEAACPYAGVIPARSFMERCMIGKGWTRES